MDRRNFFRAAGLGSAALVSPGLADALTGRGFASAQLKAGAQPADTFVILLEGTYKPVVRCPDLGLSQVNLCDGSYSTVRIFPVSGLAEEHGKHGNRRPRSHRDDRADGAIGRFYVQFGGELAVYDLPGGAVKMVFTANNVVRVPDGEEGTFIVGTFDLDITDATGAYESFIGGHNTMVDTLHRLADGTFVEHCFCVISRP